MLKISKKFVFCFVGVFVLFAGGNCGNFPLLGPFQKIMSNVMAVWLLFQGGYSVLKKGRVLLPGPVCLCYLIFVLFDFFNVLLHGGGFSFNNVTSMGKAGIAILWVDIELRRNPIPIFYGTLVSMTLWVILDSVTTFLYPFGMPLLYGGYLLGWKNNKIMFFFLANLLHLYNYLRQETRKKRVLYFFGWSVFALIGMLNALIVQSSTTTFVIALLLISPFILPICKKLFGKRAWFIPTVHGVINVIMILFMEYFQKIVGSIMQLLFNKDATLTGRVYIWEMVKEMIPSAPILGYGDFGVQYVKLPSGYYYGWESAHNQVLHLWLRGGVILLGIWIVCVYQVVKKNYKNETNFQVIANMALFSFLFFFITEAGTQSLVFLIFLFICAAESLYDIS